MKISALRLRINPRPFLLAAIVFYFSYHLISGEKGVLALLRLQQEFATLSTEAKTVRNERLMLEQRVEKMSEHAMDQDLAEEQARWLLGMARKGENVLYLPEEKGPEEGLHAAEK